MKSSSIFAACLLVLAMVAGLPRAFADTVDAMCEVRKDGDKKKGASGPCTFSQRQGYIDLDLRNGNSIKLNPGGNSNHYKDESGNKVVRSVSGNSQTYKWENGRKIIVTFGGESSASGGDRVAVGDMSRHCAGEASAKFGRSPRDITTQAPAKDKGMYSVWGQYPASPSPQVFICTFTADGRFVGVDKYRP